MPFIISFILLSTESGEASSKASAEAVWNSRVCNSNSADGAGHGLRKPRANECAIFTTATQIVKSGGNDDVVPQQERPKMEVVHVGKFVEHVSEYAGISSP